ncbi:tellurite resistance/C4-dicarboxylate transporter family protein [[Mycobacterium] crassicus]|uniref:Tellurite resistance/C4-dicarboxylate transporter family protein n=1 Tax=[Mycobacterium] crassicus TaxID=2872309 RepID=A0ABU5XIE7_9MYCO|nr:tellurite resistance/C4-dicarboxylate transporter family protein [Mycolicibacter sp. MYC098]MEB3021958.1 tellurite resistance/C4-dicarboxylate transporter family protein [Mycolicibacter sp. MYC098]
MGATTTVPATGTREAVRTLNPGYFALVMASGMVSMAMYHQQAYQLSVLLLWVTVVSYLILVTVSAVRVIAFPHAFRADLYDSGRAFGLFTFVSATNVLGARLVIDGHTSVAAGLLVVSTLAWLVLGYLIPWTAVLGTSERPVVRRANGTWFIWVVASQSIAVLAAVLEVEMPQSWRQSLALLAVSSWSIGVFLYGAAGVFVALRLLLYPLVPEDLIPQYWVGMGASAITVLAGARIVEMADAPMVNATRGLIAGTSVLFWAFGTWLIPPLIAAGVWRHVVHHISLRYEAPWWSVIFPLGMYGVGSHYLGQADHLPIVYYIGSVQSWIALAAWCITFVLMLHHLMVTLRPKAR